MGLPRGVQGGAYRASIPLIRPSKLTRRENGGVGKDLSEGWCLNFAVGCTHACPFCYVDAIHKRFGSRYDTNFSKGERCPECGMRNPQGTPPHKINCSKRPGLTERKWGDYLLVPENLGEAIAGTNWERWAGKEVMMSSTHDPFLPQLYEWAGMILAIALGRGVRFCIQTRSYLITKYLDLLSQYPEQVRLQVSIATMDEGLSRRIEPRVPLPQRRLEVLRRAKEAGLRTGVILAPVFPPCALRPDVAGDLDELAAELASIGPDRIYGESLHARGANLELTRAAAGADVRTADGAADASLEMAFHVALGNHGLRGTWWGEG